MMSQNTPAATGKQVGHLLDTKMKITELKGMKRMTTCTQKVGSYTPDLSRWFEKSNIEIVQLIIF